MIILRRIEDEHNPYYSLINTLYDISFPQYEQRSYQGRAALMAVESYSLYLILEDKKFIGFIGSWKIGDIFYIEHLAINQTLRGNGYGQKILNKFCEQVGKVILEIDPIIDDISGKRLRFYQHCGFNINDFAHEHPCYHPHYAPHQLVVLSFPLKISQQQYTQFNQFLVNTVMNPLLL